MRESEKVGTSVPNKNATILYVLENTTGHHPRVIYTAVAKETGFISNELTPQSATSATGNMTSTMPYS
jgi:hypothetical protein